MKYTKLDTVNILKKEIKHAKSCLLPEDTGHIHTSINWMTQRVDELEEEKLEIYRNCSKLCETVLTYDKNSRVALKYLAQFYYFLDMEDKRKATESICMEVYGAKCTQL